jgi:L-lactate dehydrogenase
VKIGIVGTGFVGAATGFALVTRDLVSELVLVDAVAAKAEGEAMDIAHATPFSHPARVVSGGYERLQGSAVVIVTAGVNQQPGETRLDLTARNAAIFREVVPRIVASAPEALLLVATNPVDVLTYVAWQASGLSPERVIGSGTTLDTARLRTLVAERADVSPNNVHGYVLGEHGDSEIVAWSSLRVAGLPLHRYLEQRGKGWSRDVESQVQDEVRRAAYEIIARKGATYFGVAAALARIVEAVRNDERSVLTVSLSHGDVAYSLPRIVGRSGVVGTLDPRLDDDERRALESSVATVRAAVATL